MCLREYRETKIHALVQEIVSWHWTMTFTPPRKEQEFTLHVGKQFDHHAVRASACDGSIADTPSAISLVLKSTSSAQNKA